MARGVNKVILIGVLGKDVESRVAASGNAICNFTMATSKSWLDKASGQKQEKTEWHQITAFGKTAEACGQYLSKGKKVYLEGEINYEKYTDKAGVEKYSTKIIAEKVEFLSPREESSAPSAQPARRAAPRPAAARDDFDDQDLPF